MPRRWTMVTAAAVGLVTSVVSVHAQPSPPTEEARQLAVTMFDLENDQGFYEVLIQALHDQWVDMVANSSDHLDPSSQTLFDQVLLPQLRAHFGELRGRIVEVYASNYSVEELKGIVSFDQSPLGRRMSELRPVLNRQTLAAESAWMAAAFAEMAKQMPAGNR